MFNAQPVGGAGNAYPTGTRGPFSPGITASRGPSVMPPGHLRPAVHPQYAPAAHVAAIGRAAARPSRTANADIVDAFVASGSSTSAENVLKVTTAAIRRCGRNHRAADACFAELDRCVRPGTPGMPSERVVPNVITYSAVISAHEKAGDARGAVIWFNHLLDNGASFATEQQPHGVVPNVITYNAVISAHEKAGDARGAASWFNHLLAKGASFATEQQPHGVVPDVITYSAVISAHEKAGDARGAVIWFNHLLANGASFATEQQPHGVVPNVITYNAVISAHEKAGDAPGAAYWFNHLLANGASFATKQQPHGVVPDVITYSAVISAHEKAGDARGAASWFNHLLDYGASFATEQQPLGVVPHVTTYNAVISAHEKAGDARGAASWFNHLLAKGASFATEQQPQGVVPDVITYNAVISAHEKAGDARGAAYWFNHLLANGASFATEQQPQGVVPDVITYNAVISAHEKAGLHQQTFALLDLATHVGVFKRSLGFDAAHNLLDFHEPAVVTQPQPADRPQGLPADVAKAIFRYLNHQGTINRQTTFVVGRHGEGQLKQAIKQCMIGCGWDPQHPRNEYGIENDGRWVARPLKLDPFAAEFQPGR